MKMCDFAFGCRRHLFLTSAIVLFCYVLYGLYKVSKKVKMNEIPELEINIEDIIAMLDNSKRPIKEGEAILLADHILMCGISIRCKDTICITSFITQSSKIHDKPHEINIRLSVDNKLKKIFCQCSCAAGTGGKCKHIFATLLYVNRHRVSKLEQISCTDVRQQWSKIKKKIDLPYSRVTSIDKYCHFSKADAVIDYNEFSEDTKTIFFNKLIASAPKSESAIHFSQKRKTKECFDTSDYSEEYILQLSLIHSLLERDHYLNYGQIDVFCASDFYKKNVQLLHSDSVTLFMKTLGQNNDTWKKARMCRITGSVCYEIYAYTSNKSPDWNKKVQSIFYSTFEGNASTRYGTLNESKAIEQYEKQLNLKTEKAGFFVNPLCLWLGYSADGVVWSTNTLIEVKCPMQGKKESAIDLINHVPFITILPNNGISFKQNHKYYALVQLGMMLLGFPKCHFILYSSFDNSIFVIELFYDKSYCENMVNTLKPAYFSHILPIIESKGLKK